MKKKHLKITVMLNLFQHPMIKGFRNKFGMTFGRGFTLAEVLITLTIIGVIAALTIPNLMRKWSDHADVARVKEAYSILGNALKMAVAENGSIDSWEFVDKSDKQKNADFFGERISKYLKLQKYCGSNNGCFLYGWQNDGSYSSTIAGYYRTLNNSMGNLMEGYGSYKASKLILQNGMYVKIDGANLYDENNYGSVFIDINGKNKPNRLGYDIFFFGIKDNMLRAYSFWNSAAYCNKTSPYAGDADRDGVSCAYWIMRHDNMDYKYRDVSAEW